MAGPTQQSTNTVIIPPGEGRRTYSSVSLAWSVENLEVTTDGALKSVVGPSILRIQEEAFNTATGYEDTNIPLENVDIPDGVTDYGWKSGRPHSVFFASFLNGSANTLIYRFGSKIYRFLGGIIGRDEVIASGFTSQSNPQYPDQYVMINDNVIWTNGVDRAQIISYDGSSEDLGYSQRASTPNVSGPTHPGFDEAPQYYPNAMGYSWQGRIGTPGDVLTGRSGSLLSGRWYYYFQYEDLDGNLSEFSMESEPASISSNQADPFRSVPVGSSSKGRYALDEKQVPQGTEIDDLTRRFLVRASGDAPAQTAAVHIYRTPDTLHTGIVPRFVARVPGSRQFVYDDNAADSDLGPEWQETTSVPVFRVACAHQGRLVIGNVPGDPGIVRRSEAGFPGTFLKDDFIYPDSGGAEITALASHNNVLLTFTENALYAVGDDFSVPQPLSQGVGCIAPRSIQARRDGTLIWLAHDGFYGMRSLGEIVRISSPIDRVFKSELNLSRLRLAAATLDSETGDYRCALAPQGDRDNTLVFCFDGEFWRRQSLGVHIADMTTTTDWRKYTFAIGSDLRESSIPVKSTAGFGSSTPVNLSRMFVLNRQTTDWFGPPRRILYRSAWIRAAEGGLVPTNVRMLYVGLLDAWNGNATVRLYKNGSWKPMSEMKDVLLVGPDDGSDIVKDVAGSAVVGESSTRDPRLSWRQIPVDIQNANSWAFEIELIGSPGPNARTPVGGAAPPKDRELGAWTRLMGDETKATELYDAAYDDPSLWELGRIHIAAFAFDSSIATKGSPLGRVPKRQDK